MFWKSEPTTYLDANANTFMSTETADVVYNWFNRGNASARYQSATEARTLMQEFRNELAKYTSPDFHFIFTSGASESNAQIIRGTSMEFARKTGRVPHIVASAAEHKSIIMCLQQLKDHRLITYTLVRSSPALHGSVALEDIKNAISQDTCLITVMSANNETGAINNLVDIYRYSRSVNTPFHTDAVQMFGKKPSFCSNCDAFSVSFHKLRGPIGCGLLGIRGTTFPNLIPAMVCGTQNDELRGGTYNMPAIAGSFVAFKECMGDFVGRRWTRDDKNMLLADRRRELIEKLFVLFKGNVFQFGIDDVDTAPATCVWLLSPLHVPKSMSRFERIAGEGHKSLCLPNTLMISVMKPGLCNRMIIDRMLERKIIVSAGSACNTSSENMSHVLVAMEVPVEIGKSSVRISFDDSTAKDPKVIDKFISVLGEIVSG